MKESSLDWVTIRNMGYGNEYARFCLECGVLLAVKEVWSKEELKLTPIAKVSLTPGLCGSCDLRKRFYDIYDKQE